MNLLRLTMRSCIIIPLLLAAACSRQPSYPSAPEKGPDIEIDAAGLDPETPKFYTLRHEGKNISYFLLKVRGKVLSFLDACATCYIHKRGYRYDDGSVTCRYCNMKFSIYGLERGLGGCYPIRIEGRMENGNYLIPRATLEAAKNRF